MSRSVNREIAGAVLGVLVAYLVMVYTLLEWNPLVWPAGARMFHLLTSVLAALVGAANVRIEKGVRT